jgi:hypothetical protein
MAESRRAEATGEGKVSAVRIVMRECAAEVQTLRRMHEAGHVTQLPALRYLMMLAERGLAVEEIEEFRETCSPS